LGYCTKKTPVSRGVDRRVRPPTHDHRHRI